MTARQVWEACLVETAKEGAPPLLLEDFNYFINRSVQQYINKRYNIYDVNQQTTDDLRVLKSTAILKPKLENKVEIEGDDDTFEFNAFGSNYYVNLPLDYFHMLNCVCVYKVNGRYKCYNNGDTVQFAARRLTADAWSQVLNNYYTRPLPQRPYYYINHVNTSADLPTNPTSGNTLNNDFTGTDPEEVLSDKVTTEETVAAINQGLPEYITIGGKDHSLVEKEAGYRYGNPTNIRCEIRYGEDDDTFKLKAVIVDYIKTPQLIRLTQSQINRTQDTSQIMEFPDYVCQEIINELVLILMEHTADPRTQTHLAVSQSIPSAQQQQA